MSARSHANTLMRQESDVFSEEEDEEFEYKEHVFVHGDFLERHDTRSPPKKRTKTESHPRSPTPEVQHSQHDSSTLSKKNRLGYVEEHVVPDGGGLLGSYFISKC